MRLETVRGTVRRQRTRPYCTYDDVWCAVPVVRVTTERWTRRDEGERDEVVDAGAASSA